MELRTLDSGERERLLDLLDGWPFEDGWRGRDFFRRYVEHDPTFEERNVWVAETGGRLVSCVQIFPRRIRVRGAEVPTGGIGSVFTDPGHRNSGIASRLLQTAVASMRERGMELSLLFAVRIPWYTRLGWRSWRVRETILDPPSMDELPPSEGGTVVETLDRELLPQVMDLHHAYSSDRDGTVVRDRTLWEGSLRLAGNPTEEFLVAREEGNVAAYLRSFELGARLQVGEWGRRDHAAERLADLFAHVLRERPDDPLAREGLESARLRQRAFMPPLRDAAVRTALEGRGFRIGSRIDPSAMLRCLDLGGLSRRLDIPAEKRGPDAYLRHILGPERFSFWPTDRF